MNLLSAAARVTFNRGIAFARVNTPPDCLALVVLFFALRERDLDFHQALFEIHRKRHDRAAFLRGLPLQAVDLGALQQKFARARRIHFDVALDFGVRRDVAIKQEGLAAEDPDEGILQIDSPLADGFDLGAEKGDARLEFVLKEVIVLRFAVNRDRLHN